jgi:Ser/Thr protein kinase RdoA (MazF antagonist)
MPDSVPVRVLTSLIAPGALSLLAEAAYDLGAPAHSKLVSHNDNDHYLLTAGERRHVLRVYRHQKHWLRGESDYLFELDWLDFLHQRGLPVSHPIRRRDGGFLGSLAAPEGLRYWALFSLAEGRITRMDPVKAEIFGRSIAQIHVESNDFSSPHERVHFDLDQILEKPVLRIRASLGDDRGEDLEFLGDLAGKLRRRVRETRFSGDAYGIIGGDFHGGNHYFTEENRVTHFDLDLCGYGWRAYDLAIFRWAGGGPDELWQPFLDGYQSVRPLSETEMEMIPTFVQLRQIWLMGSHTTYAEADSWLTGGDWDRKFTSLRKMAEREETGAASES